MKSYIKIFLTAIILSTICYLIIALFFTKKEEVAPIPNDGIKIEQQK
jgi:hypothetical protein